MDEHSLTIDLAKPGVLELSLGNHVAQVPFDGRVDNRLLTSIDKLLQEHRIDKSALESVTVGDGIDKNSSLYRMVKSFAAAIAAAHKGQK